MHALLHVEDEDAMAVAFREAVDEAGLEVLLCRVSDGKAALEYLRRAGTYAASKRPDVVFLDLNMPMVDGWQVLTAMRADDSLRPIPVVILTTSSRLADKERAYALGAQHYLTKPTTFTGLVDEIRSAYRKVVTLNNSSATAGHA